MKIRGNTVGTTLKPEVILATPKDLTEEEKAQARQNIGAMPSVADAELDMNHKSIINVTSIEFDQGIGLSATGSIYHSNGVRLHFASNLGDKKVGLSGIADGEGDNDVATVGQMNKAIADAVAKAIANITNGDEVSY